MTALRNFALIILGLVISFIINHYGAGLAALIFVPLFLFWFSFWDDKRFRQRQYRRSYKY